MVSLSRYWNGLEDLYRTLDNLGFETKAVDGMSDAVRTTRGKHVVTIDESHGASYKGPFGDTCGMSFRKMREYIRKRGRC